MNLIEKATGRLIASDILSINESGAHGADFMLPGNFLEAYELRPNQKTVNEEEKALQIRSERNRLLSESDWTQVADAPVDQAAWATYRQALRDVTSQSGFPWEVQWPSQP